MTDISWFIEINGESHGPFNAGDMNRYKFEGRLIPSTLVWREGMAEWQPAGSTELFAAGGAAAARTAAASLPGASFGEATRRFWSRYVTFSGRASRSEYWWAMLMLLALNIVAGTLDVLLFGGYRGEMSVFSGILNLASILPSLAVSVRRLHDIDKSGFWVLLVLVPVIGWVVLLIFHLLRGTQGPNRFGY